MVKKWWVPFSVIDSNDLADWDRECKECIFQQGLEETEYKSQFAEVAADVSPRRPELLKG